MSQDAERRIRERAYQIWQENGCPEGSDHEHWFLAEQEVAATALPTTDGATAAPPNAVPKKAPKPAAERKPRARKAAVTA